MPANARDEVVEIVRDAAGEISECFEFARVGELLFGAQSTRFSFFTLRDVDLDSGEAGQPTTDVPPRLALDP